MKGPLSSYEKRTIRELLDQNHSHNQIAKITGRSQSTVSTFAKREGYSPLPERTPYVANQARRQYGKAERLELIALVFERGEELLSSPDLTPRAYKEVVTGIAIAVDKSRLEEGSPSRVHETRSGTPHVGSINLEEEFAALDARMEQEHRKQPFEESEYGSPGTPDPGLPSD